MFRPSVQRKLAFWLPKGCTFLSFLIASLVPTVIAHSVTIAYVFAAAITGAGSVTLLLLAKRRFRNGVTLSGLVIQAALMILNFAAIHHAFGVADTSGDHLRQISFTTATYFSVVTWTTLGYGDYAPAQPLQLIAALEAGIGYIYLGLIVGVAANIFGQDPNG